LNKIHLVKQSRTQTQVLIRASMSICFELQFTNSNVKWCQDSTISCV